MMKFLKQTKDDILTLEAKNLTIANWHTDVAFAIHPDFRSHTEMNLSFGKGTVTGVSQKQKMNTRSSTEAELVGTDEAMSPMIWTVLFMESQGYPILENILIRIIQVQSYWRLMTEKVQEREHDTSTLGYFM